MAVSSMKDIKLRIKSIQGTRQITKAMQLVASSKLRRAKEKMEQSIPYNDTLDELINKLSLNPQKDESIFFSGRETKKVCHCIIAGDRGLAGGYNTNAFKEAINHINSRETETVILPIGKKAIEFFKKKYAVLDEMYSDASDISIGTCYNLGNILCEKYLSGEFDELYVTYTKYKNVLHQDPVTVKVLPLPQSSDEKRSQLNYESGFCSVVKHAVPMYISSIIHTGVCQSYASELTARQNAMDTATGNADEMLEQLQLQYNRVRQAGITQEITEIVAGANM